MKKNRTNKSRQYDFTTISGMENDIVYNPDNFDDKFMSDINLPGEFPYTRGIHHNMYRGKLWTMRQFSGFGSPEDTNKRYKFLLKNGQTGLSVAFDMPTLMGYDPDHKLSNGEVGHCGVSISNLLDMEKLFKDIDILELLVRIC